MFVRSFVVSEQGDNAECIDEGGDAKVGSGRSLFARLFGEAWPADELMRRERK